MDTKKEYSKKYSLEELDKIITAHNTAVESLSLGNIAGGSLFEATKKVSQKSEGFIPNVDDITIPAFRKYMEDFSARSKHSKNPIAKAIAEGKPLAEIKALLSQYKKTNKILYQDGDGNTLMHLAVATESQTTCLLELVKELRKDISVNESNQFGMEPYHMAIASDKQWVLFDLHYIGDINFHIQKWNNNLVEEQSNAERKDDSCDFS